jgi:Mg-chelatase subunit ChlD
MKLDSQARQRNSRRGAIVILFAVMLVLVVALVAVSVDLGYVCSVKADLQAAVDAGSLAGVSVLLDDPKKAKQTAEQYSRLNLNNQGVRTAGNEEITVDVGSWNFDTRRFTPGLKPHDAVRVSTRVANNGLFFGRALGKSHFTSESSAIATFCPRDIMLVLDISGSMTQMRNGVRKIDELKGATNAFMDELGNADAEDQVGFTYYSTTAALGSPLDRRLKNVQSVVNNRLKAEGWTNIADGMRLALDEFSAHRRSQAVPLMIVLTDGAANLNQPGNWYDTYEAKRRVIEQANIARQRKIPVFTIALDSLNVEVDVQLMAQVAQITGSESYHIIAGDGVSKKSTQLHEAFRRIARNRPLRIVD